jgi:uncharacterized protein YbjT (DUF2867 family)
MTRTALVAGATGLIGELLLRQLASRKEYSEIRVIGRRPPAHEAAKFTFVMSDFANLDALGAALAVDDVYCCLGTTIRKAGSAAAFERVDYHMVVDLARAAHKAGAKRFIVVSAVGSSLKSPAPYSRVKARMEQAVSGVAFEAVHILRPSLLLGDRAERRPAERAAQILAPLLSPLMIGPLKKYRAVPAREVASAMIHLALEGGAGTHVHHLPL